MKVQAPRKLTVAVSDKTISAENSAPVENFALKDSAILSGPNGNMPMTGDDLDLALSQAVDSTVDVLNSENTKENSQNALLATDMTSCLSHAGKAAPGLWMTALGGVGGAFLLANGVTRAVKSKDPMDKLEALSDTNWGAQTALPILAKMANWGSWAVTAAQNFGVVGGTIQTGLGVKRTIEGITDKNVEKSTLGGVDVVAGGSWALAAMGIAPAITIPTFLALTVGSKAYQFRDKLKHLAIKGKEKLEKLID